VAENKDFCQFYLPFWVTFPCLTSKRPSENDWLFQCQLRGEIDKNLCFHPLESSFICTSSDFLGANFFEGQNFVFDGHFFLIWSRVNGKKKPFWNLKVVPEILHVLPTSNSNWWKLMGENWLIGENWWVKIDKIRGRQ